MSVVLGGLFAHKTAQSYFDSKPKKKKEKKEEIIEEEVDI